MKDVLQTKITKHTGKNNVARVRISMHEKNER